jgi:RNA recognition motif-containing protein
LQLPYQAGWQDLKDLFRSAGNIVRADINIGPDGRAKGSGTVIFETVNDAQNAISACIACARVRLAGLLSGAGMYNGFQWFGRVLEVREVCPAARCARAPD